MNFNIIQLNISKMVAFPCVVNINTLLMSLLHSFLHTQSSGAGVPFTLIEYFNWNSNFSGSVANVVEWLPHGTSQVYDIRLSLPPPFLSLWTPCSVSGHPACISFRWLSSVTVANESI